MKDNSLKIIYSKIRYLQKHKKAYIEYYEDIDGNKIYSIMKKKKNGTTKEIAKYVYDRNEYLEVWNNIDKIYEKNKFIVLFDWFPAYKLVEYKNETIKHIADKINQAIKIRKTGGLIIK